MDTDAITASLKKIHVADGDDALQVFSATQNKKRQNDDLPKSSFTAPPVSPQKKRIRPIIKGHRVAESKTMSALQQEIEELEFHPKLKVFWGHGTGKKSQSKSRQRQIKGSQRPKLRKKGSKSMNNANSDDNWQETDGEMSGKDEHGDIFAPKSTASAGLESLDGNGPEIKVTAERQKKMTGRPSDPLLDKLVRSFVDEISLKEKWECVGGCSGAQWTNRSKPRILAHAVTCPRLSPKLKNEASLALAMSSKGRIVEEWNEDTEESQPQMSKTEPKLSSKVHSKPGLSDLFTTTGKKQQQDRLDFAILILFCVAGIALHVLDIDEWNAHVARSADAALACLRHEAPASTRHPLHLESPESMAARVGVPLLTLELSKLLSEAVFLFFRDFAPSSSVEDTGPFRAHLRASGLIQNLELHLERNKSISFLVCRDYECCRAPPSEPQQLEWEEAHEWKAETFLVHEHVTHVS